MNVQKLSKRCNCLLEVIKIIPTNQKFSLNYETCGKDSFEIVLTRHKGYKMLVESF